MNTAAEKNRVSWNRFAEVYSEFNHSNKMLARIKANPACIFRGNARGKRL